MGINQEILNIHFKHTLNIHYSMALFEVYFDGEVLSSAIAYFIEVNR